MALHIDVFQPAKLKDPSILSELRQFNPQVMVVVAYGLLLNRPVLQLPDLGCVNVHASLLPRWRGAAPIHRAIEAGDRETGISIMQMDEGLDTGPVLATQATPISPRDTAGSLHDRLALLGAELLVETLKRMEQGNLEAVPQDESRATYAAKISPEDAWVDWSAPAALLERKIRAMNPWPVARTSHGGHAIRLWQARTAEGSGTPGEIVQLGPQGVDVACGEGVLRVSALQREGGKKMSAAEFLNGYRIDVGQRFDS